MNEHLKMLEGIKAVQNLSENSVRETLTWLREAVEVYEAILQFKLLLKATPETLKPVVEHVTINISPHTIDEKEVPFPREGSQTSVIFKRLMEVYPNCMPLSRIREITGYEHSQISTSLSSHRHTYFENTSHGNWKIKESYALRYFEMERNKSQMGNTSLQSQL